MTQESSGNNDHPREHDGGHSSHTCSLGQSPQSHPAAERLSWRLHLRLTFLLPQESVAISISLWHLVCLAGHGSGPPFSPGCLKPPIPAAEALNSDSNQNKSEILPKQVLSDQILTGSVTDSVQLEWQRLHRAHEAGRTGRGPHFRPTHCFQALSWY